MSKADCRFLGMATLPQSSRLVGERCYGTLPLRGAAHPGYCYKGREEEVENEGVGGGIRNTPV